MTMAKLTPRVTELPFPAGAPKDLKVSFEFFPPKTEKIAENLWSSITRLAPLQPRFVSVTYGAGGSTRERTHSTVVRILRETNLTPARFEAPAKCFGDLWLAKQVVAS